MPSPTLPDFKIVARSPLSRGVVGAGINTFAALIQHVLRIPYGRITSDSPLAVLVENRGTCSSKHRLLAEVAREFEHPEIALMIGIYDMSENNTPGIRVVLDEANVESIPEAHCYLMIDGARFDLTGLRAGNVSPFQSLVTETGVLPVDLAQTKKHLHTQALRIWAHRHGRSLDDAWVIREACIAALAGG